MEDIAGLSKWEVKLLLEQVERKMYRLSNLPKQDSVNQNIVKCRKLHARLHKYQSTLSLNQLL